MLCSPVSVELHLKNSHSCKYMKSFIARNVLLLSYPLYTALVIGLTRERSVALGLRLWTHLRWGVFTLQGLKDLCFVGLAYSVAKAVEKVKAGSTTQRCLQGAFCRCCWNRRDVILFSVVRKITDSRENRGELLGDQVMKTTSHRNCSLQVTLIEFEQLLQGRKWELVFTL